MWFNRIKFRIIKSAIKNSNVHLLRFYKNLPIRRKLLLVLNILIIVPLVFIGYMSYKNSEEIIKKKSTDYSQDILRMIELRLKDYVHNLTVISQDLLADRRIYGVLNNDNGPDSDGPAYDPLRNYEDDFEIGSVLKKVILSRNEIQSICFVSNNGSYYFADNNSKKMSIKEVIPYDGSLFKKVLSETRKLNGKPVWYLDVEDRKVRNVFLARTVYNNDTFKEIGLMVIWVKKEFLETVYQDLVNEDMQNIAIVSSNNEQIVSRNPGHTVLFEQGFPQQIKEENGWLIDEERGALISYVSMTQPSWRVVSYISLKELYKEIGILRQNIILLCVITVFILSILSIYIAFDLIKPINKLVKGMERVQKGDNDVYIELDRKDELGFLGQAFNKMVKEINNLVTWIYREQLTRKEAELKALQSQINPHFLFNTLESINWMAHLNNVPEISETVTALSSLMEAGIGRDDKLITVEEEFTYIDNYILILKKRFEDRLELFKKIETEARTVNIPRLLIQPLIENAIYHGIENSREKGIIQLNAYIKSDMLIVEVEDNGSGIDRDELEMINEKLAMDNDTYFRNLNKKKTKSIGMENVNRRIKLFYGESYGLKIESEQGRYTRVIVTIPLTGKSKGEQHVQGSYH